MTFNDFYNSLVESEALPELTMDMILAVIVGELRAERLRLTALQNELSNYKELLLTMSSRPVLDRITPENQAIAKERLRGNIQRVEDLISTSTNKIARLEVERDERAGIMQGPQG